MQYRKYKNPESVPTKDYVEHPNQQGVFLPVHRRPTRLTEMDYRARDCLCFVTFNVHTECPVRFTGDVGETAWQALWYEIQLMGCTIYAACLMPDHIHLLVAPSGKGESISDIVRRLKTRICAQLRQQFGLALRWQPSFYDHVLRQAEKVKGELEAILNYIDSNPERAGLGTEYPFRFRTTL